MKIYNGTKLVKPDSIEFDKFKMEQSSVEITFDWIVDIEEEGYYKTIAEYPNGGKDVEWVATVPGKGHWHIVDEFGNVISDFNPKIDGMLPNTPSHDLPESHSTGQMKCYFLERMTDEESEQYRIELEKQEQFNERSEKIDIIIENLPETEDERDEAICDLYEQSLSYQADTDEAICSLFEMIMEGGEV